MLERPQSLRAASLDPIRELVWLGQNGAIVARRSAPAGRALLDVTVHPSGDVTALTASNDGFTFVRYDASAPVRGEQALVDPAIETDPPAMHPEEPRSPIEPHTHDVGRLDTDGEGIVVATRTGRHSVIAYRMAFVADEAHNEARFVLPAGDGRLWVGGMHDGPGTHSGDADESLVRARAFVDVIDAP